MSWIVVESIRMCREILGHSGDAVDCRVIARMTQREAELDLIALTAEIRSRQRVLTVLWAGDE